MRKCDRAEEGGETVCMEHQSQTRGGVPFVRGRPSVFKNKWVGYFFTCCPLLGERRAGHETNQASMHCSPARAQRDRRTGCLSDGCQGRGRQELCPGSSLDRSLLERDWLPWSEKGSREQRCAVCMEENGRGSGEEMRWPKP